MPPERHAARNPGDVCYLLTARLRHQPQAVVLNGFRSIPEAQAGMAEFVLATAQLGEITDICLERRETRTSVSSDAPPEVIKRWNGELVARILAQKGLPLDQRVAEVAPAANSVEIRGAIETASPAGCDQIGACAQPLFRPNDADLASDPQRPAAPHEDAELNHRFSPHLDDLTGAAACPNAEQVNGASERIQQLAQAVEPYTLPRARQGGPESSKQKPLPQRPLKGARHSGHHRRTRWELAVAIVLTAAVAFIILLWDSGGDPISLFLPRAATNLPRESLPFQVRPPASRSAGANIPSHP